jgi:hypothetical protein
MLALTLMPTSMLVLVSLQVADERTHSNEQVQMLQVRGSPPQHLDLRGAAFSSAADASYPRVCVSRSGWSSRLATRRGT